MAETTSDTEADPEVETESPVATGPGPETEFDTEPELPQLPVTPVTAQHPALGGDMQGEIEHRTPEPTDEGVFTKTFSVGVIGVGDDHPMHLANAGGVIQEAVQRGLHPKGDVMLVASEEHDYGRRHRYTNLTYQVKVVPAIVDHDAASTVTQRMIAEAVAARRETDGGAVIGEHGPELEGLPAGSTVTAPPEED